MGDGITVPVPDPWVAIDATIRRSSKMTGLSGDAARWGWIIALGEAKLLRRHGTFTRNQWREVMGSRWKYLPEYIAAGLLHEAPALCLPGQQDQCLEGRREFIKDGILVIHDWPAHQREIVEPGTGPQAGRTRTANWRMRSAVFQRDDFTCRYCGVADYPREWLVLEHVIPSHRDESTDTMDNLVTACRGCNHKKGGRTPAEAGMRLLPEPRAPSQINSVARHGDVSPVSVDSPLSRSTGVGSGAGAPLSDEAEREHLDTLKATMEEAGIPLPAKPNGDSRLPHPARSETEPEYVARLQRIADNAEEVGWKRDAARAQLEAMRVQP